MSLHKHRTELAIVLAVLVVVASLLTAFKVLRIDLMHGDDAQQFSTTEGIATRGVGWSNVAASVFDYSYVAHIPSMPGSEYATNPLLPPKPAEINLLGFHSYYILYPLALVTKIVPTPVVLFGVDCLCFVGLVGLAYFVLRRAGVAILAAAIFALLVVSHPSWGLGVVWGQFYPDRLYLLFGFVFMYFASQGREGRYGLLISAFLCALIDERAALVSGLFLVVYVALFWKTDRDRFLKLGLGFALLFYGEFIVKFVLVNPEYSTFLPTSIDQVLSEFRDPVFANGALIFLLVNAPLLALALFRWRWAILAFVMMLPNIVGNIGGAEKTGWSTHYHASYFPALVLAAVFGTIALWQRCSAARRLPTVAGVLLVLTLLLSMTNRYSDNDPIVGPSNIANSFLGAFPTLASTWISPTGMQLFALGDDVRDAVPEGSMITSIESGMPLLYHNRNVQFFPVGIDQADYAVMSIDASDPSGRPQLGGTIDFLGPADSKASNIAVRARMRRDGYDFVHAAIFPRLGIGIVRRVGGNSKPFPVADQWHPPVAPVATKTPKPVAYLKPRAVASIVQHSATVAAAGIGRPTDLTAKLGAKPTPGHILIAFASTGFGCVVSPGWSLVGTDPSTSAALAFHVVRPGDGLTYVPFTTPTVNGYSIMLVEVAGDPAILASPQSGGGYVLSDKITNTQSLAIPQTGGMVLEFYGGSGGADQNGAPVSIQSSVAAGHTMKRIARIPAEGHAFEMIAETSSSDPRSAPQPFTTSQTLTYRDGKSPGNITVGWLVWVGGVRP